MSKQLEDAKNIVNNQQTLIEQDKKNLLEMQDKIKKIEEYLVKIEKQILFWKIATGIGVSLAIVGWVLYIFK